MRIMSFILGMTMFLGCGDDGVQPIDASMDHTADAADAPNDAAIICTPGAFVRCEGNNIVQCNSDGTQELTSSCEGSFGCNSVKGQCNVCQAGSKSCSPDGQLIVCSDDGSMQTAMTCDHPICKN